MATGRIPTTANSPLTAKGDLFTFSTGSAKLAVGNNGETLVADSSTSTGLRWQGDYAAGKNLIINGDFNIWQRGTSFTNPSFDTYTADRWRNANYDNAPTSRSITRETFTPGTAPVSGYEGRYFWRSTITTVGTNTIYDTCSQRIEGVLSSGATVTVSFWAKSDSTRTQNIRFIQNYGSGGSGDSDIVGTTSFSTTTSWQRFTFTGTVASATGKTIGTSPFAYFLIRQASASGSVLDVWGVQAEYGSVATAFQTATGTLQGELAACQRYYFRYTAATAAGNYMPFGMGHGIDANNARFMFQFPVALRGNPTLTFTAASTFQKSYGNALTAIATGETARNSVSVDVTKIGDFAANQGVLITAANNQTAYIEVSAEL